MDSWNSNDQYWALLPPEDLIKELKLRRKEFWEFFKSTDLYERIQRSYLFFHGQYHEDGYGQNAIKIGGPEGSLRYVQSNEYRSIVSLLKTFIVAGKPEWDAITKIADADALEATKLANRLLDGFMLDTDYDAEAFFGRAVEDGLVLTQGFCWQLWNAQAGDQENVEAVDPTTGEVMTGGDLELLNPSIQDVVFDYSVRQFKKSAYVLVRRPENRWDLIATYPDMAEDIKKLPAIDEAEDDSSDHQAWMLELQIPEVKCKDQVWVYYFYHRWSPAIPKGRFVRYVGDKVLQDRILLERHIPVCRFIPSQYMLTCFGYSQILDLQSPQEGLNAVLSTIATNQNSLGLNKIWTKSGEPINIADLEPGITAIQTQTPPQSLNFLQSAPELFKAFETYTMVMERLGGVAAASRGQNPPNVRSASALAMLDSRTTQGASDLIGNFRILQCEVGTSIVKTLRYLTSGARVMSLVGAHGARFVQAFKAQDLEGVEKVAVVTGNPLMGTLSGRMSVAEQLVTSGLIKTPEEYLTVIKTGELDALTETSEMQLRSAAAENDAVLKGQPPGTSLVIDDHVLHIKKHLAILDTPVTRADVRIAPVMLAHIGTHVTMLQDPFVQQLMIILGYQLPPMPGQMAPGGAGVPPESATAGQGEASQPAAEGGPPDAVDSQVAQANDAYTQ